MNGENLKKRSNLPAIAADFVPSPNPSHRAWPLDLLRILAALMVLVQHWSIVGLSQVVNSDFLRSLFSYGYLGVDIFFFISGIVITRSAINADAKRFTVSRFARLAPAYLVVLLLAIPVGLYTRDSRYEASSIFSAFTFSESVTQPLGDDLLILDSWTLWIEIQFYFLIALILVIFGIWQTIARRQQTISLSVFKIVFSIWLAFIALNMAGNSGIPALFTLGGFASAFLCGGLFGTVIDRGSLVRLSPVLLLATTLMFYGFYERTLNSSATLGGLSVQNSHAAVAIGLVAICLVSVMVGLVVRPLSKSLARVITALALATYPLYLLHQELGNRVILKLTESGIPVTLSLVITLMGTVALSLLISMFVEPPIRRTLLKFG